MSEHDGSGEGRFADDGQRFRLDSRIATGGMGEVWRATDTVLGREVAVKLLKAEYADDATFRSRFETEARHAAALHHPGVASVYDVGEAGSTDGSGHPRPFLVMELVPGQPLSTLLAEARGAQRELDPEVVRDLMAQTGDALGAAHRAGIVHRDVKPANLMVTPAGVVKVTDFGIARAAEGVGITRTGAVMGTPQYLSPEQAEGKPATSASDVYALGVVTFECLAGRRPFEADSPVATALAHLREPIPELPARVPADLAAVVRRALAKDPAERFVDGSAFAAALRDPASAPAPVRRPVVPPVVPLPVDDGTQVLQQVPDPVVPVAAPYAEETGRRSPWLIALAVLLLVALAVVVLLLVTRGGSTDDTPVNGTSSSSKPPRTTSSAPPTSSAPSTVFVDKSAYVGRPYQAVVQQLSDLGLQVTAQEVPNSDPAQDGLVTDVNPSQTVPLTQPVTVSYAGTAPTQTPTSESPTTPTTPSSPATSTSPTAPVPPTTGTTPSAGVDTSTPSKGATP